MSNLVKIKIFVLGAISATYNAHSVILGEDCLACIQNKYTRGKSACSIHKHIAIFPFLNVRICYAFFSLLSSNSRKIQFILVGRPWLFSEKIAKSFFAQFVYFEKNICALIKLVTQVTYRLSLVS